MNTTTGYQAAADQQTLLIHGEMELAGDSRPVMFVHRLDTFSPAFRAEMLKLGWGPLLDYPPPGWALVPREPTAEMKLAGGAYKDRCNRERTQRTCGGYYRAMVAAAPKLAPPGAKA